MICCFLCRGAPHSFEYFFGADGGPLKLRIFVLHLFPAHMMWPTDLHGLHVIVECIMNQQQIIRMSRTMFP